jgi:signal transduction histidine kinase
MFENLIDNATKYSDGAVRIGTACEGNEVAITVADHGPGIAPQDAERIFEKFYRSDRASSQPGTGLGLFLVRQIAERHGGRVSVTSAPGNGAAFTVTLPHALPVPAR